MSVTEYCHKMREIVRRHEACTSSECHVNSEIEALFWLFAHEHHDPGMTPAFLQGLGMLDSIKVEPFLRV